MTEHMCDWRLTVGYSNCKACHYSAIEGVAVCEICNESLGPTEIERRLNATERLSVDRARQLSDDLADAQQTPSGAVMELYHDDINAIKAYADILDGK